jgi:hypothetical protein
LKAAWKSKDKPKNGSWNVEKPFVLSNVEAWTAFLRSPIGCDSKPRSPFDKLRANGILNRSTAVFRINGAQGKRRAPLLIGLRFGRL